MLFSTAGVMADSNLLWQAIDYVAKDPGISVSLELTRFNGIVVSRTDMDQAQESTDVNPGERRPGHLRQAAADPRAMEAGLSTSSAAITSTSATILATGAVHRLGRVRPLLRADAGDGE